MEKQPFFTIGIPVYNTGKWLGECLDSILSQSFTDFEIICVDDGSRDNSIEIIKKYAAQNNRIKYISRPNGGVSSARNTAIFHASGRYLYFIDSDDLMCNDTLSTAYNALEENNFPDLLETGFITRSGDGTNQSTYSPCYPGDKYFSPELTKDERAVLMWLDNTYSVCSFAKFISTDFLRTSGITYSISYSMAEDNDFSMQLHRKVSTIAYAGFYAGVYVTPREGSVISEVSPKSLYSSVSYMTNFFEAVKYYNLSQQFKNENKDKYYFKISEMIYYYISHLTSLLHGKVNKSEIMEKAAILDKFITPYLEIITVPDKSGHTMVRLFRIFGIKNTINLLYRYLKLKGVITE